MALHSFSCYPRLPLFAPPGRLACGPCACTRSLEHHGTGALAVNFACAWTLAKARHAHGSLTKAAFLSARNDVIANIAIIAAGGLTALSASGWPDLLVGLGIFAMNLDAAREVFTAAQSEHGGAPL